MKKIVDTYAKRGSTLFLRLMVIGMGAFALLLCGAVLPEINAEWMYAYPELAGWKYPLMTLLLATTVPFYIALYQTLRLLHFVDTNQAFSDVAVAALGRIAYCAVIFGALYAACMPFFYYVGQRMDAPGLIVISAVMVCAPVAIGVFAAVLQKLLQSAIDIKSENDLTV